LSAEKCLLLFCNEATIYSENTQSIKNVTKEFKIPTWHRRRPDKLSCVAVTTYSG